MLKQLNPKSPLQLFHEAQFLRSCLPELTQRRVLRVTLEMSVAKIGMVGAEMDVLLQITLDRFKRLLPPVFHYFSSTGSYSLCI